jgi:hypothetical protein
MARKSRKGASLVFEQVLLFVLGVFIFLMCFSIFRTYEVHFDESISKNQFEEVSEYIISNILMFSERDQANSTVKIRVPQMIGNDYYIIRLNQTGLHLTDFEGVASRFTPLSRINETLLLSGGFSTLHGTEFLIYKRGNQIIIG